MNIFFNGFKAILPITTGVIPFGLVMGAVFSEAKLSFFQAMTMNTFVFAGASQLAAVELMTQNTSSVVVVITAIMINLRFMLYSAALSPILQNSPFLVKLFGAYCITDQNYTVMMANQDQLKTNKETIQFYFGASLAMIFAWQGSVLLGYSFGNFAPSSWALDYAVPISFVALVLPTLKNKLYVVVAVFSALTSVILKPLPYNLGLIATASLAILLTILLLKNKKATP